MATRNAISCSCHYLVGHPLLPPVSTHTGFFSMSFHGNIILYIPITLKETTEGVSAGEGRRLPSANSVCSQFITWHIGYLSKLISVTHSKLVMLSISHGHTNTHALSLSGPCTKALSPSLLNISMGAHKHAYTHRESSIQKKQAG